MPPNLHGQSLIERSRYCFNLQVDLYSGCLPRNPRYEAIQLLRATTRPTKRVYHAARITSHTAINATKSIPSAFKQLHDSLKKLKVDAANYVDLSKLDLAIRGLESHNPLVRIAGSSYLTSEDICRFVTE